MTPSTVSKAKVPGRWVYYKAASGRVPVKEFIEEQPAAVREMTGRDFWELGTRVGGDNYRTFYCAHTGQKFVLLHAFQKKSEKAPKRGLDTAEERMRDYAERMKRR